MSIQQQSGGSSPVIQWLLLGAALLLLGSIIAYFQFLEFQRIDDQERERLTTLTEVVGKNIVPQLVLADRIITNVINDLPSWQAANDGFKRANRELKIINETINGIPPLLVMDASGTVFVSTDPKLLGENFAYRDYFKAAVQSPNPKILQVSAPFQTVLNDFAFTLVRTFTGSKGEFAGIVVVTEVPAYFINLLESVRYAPDLRASIVHGDGLLFLSAPRGLGIDGMNLAKPDTFFARHLENGQRASLFTGTVYATGDQRMMAQRTIQLSTPAMDKPLVIAVSRDLQGIFGSWRKGVYELGGLFGVLALISILSMYSYLKRQQLYDRLKANGTYLSLIALKSRA
jgi:hypothetical protein